MFPLCCVVARGRFCGTRHGFIMQVEISSTPGQNPDARLLVELSVLVRVSLLLLVLRESESMTASRLHTRSFIINVFGFCGVDNSPKIGAPSSPIKGLSMGLSLLRCPIHRIWLFNRLINR